MDVERVIKGLDIILNGCDEIQCEDCCFNIKEPAKPRRCGIDEEQIQEDALALLKEQNGLMLALDQSNAVNEYLNAEVERLNGLLKEQEAVEPEVEVLNEIDKLYRCPKCHKHFFYEKQKYCDQCGQAVKWE